MFNIVLQIKIMAAISLSLITISCTTPNLKKSAYPQAVMLAEQAPGLDVQVLSSALKAYDETKKRGLAKHAKLTVIDYSLPSSQPRLWVFDLDRNQLLYELHVTHGSKSGLLKPTQFSNKHESNQSSIGVFVTQEAYYGRYGYSLRLNGLEGGFNDNALSRGIVIHGADYATAKYAATHGALGRSWGCPAIDSKVSRKVIDELKHGSVIFAYYPDARWLQSSAFL